MSQEVKRYALAYYNEWGGYSPKMVEANTLPDSEDRLKFVFATDYDRDTQSLRREVSRWKGAYEPSQVDLFKANDGALEFATKMNTAIREGNKLREQVEAMRGLMADIRKRVPMPDWARSGIDAALQAKP